jgi:hypothetical protein
MIINKTYNIFQNSINFFSLFSDTKKTKTRLKKKKAVGKALTSKDNSLSLHEFIFIFSKNNSKGLNWTINYVPNLPKDLKLNLKRHTSPRLNI